MSGNGEQIDLNSEVHGVNLSHPVVDSINEKSRSRELGNDEAIDGQDEAAEVGFLEGRSTDGFKEMAINALSGAEMESSERRHISESIISVGVVEIQEGVCIMKDEEKKVAQIEELDFGSVDLKCDQVVKKEDCESRSLLDHEGCVDVHVNINPEGSFHDKDVDDSGSLRDNLGSVSPKSAEDGIQLTDNLDRKAENLTESNELPVPPPVLASDCSENRSGRVDDGQTIENPATGSRILKTGALTDLDESNLFDVVVEVDPHVMMDEDDISDDVSADIDDTAAVFNVSDLVWSRVPSHPWWPGQICDPTSSSKKAMKYFKSGRYLVAFYGDHTFSWKEAVMIKPFQEYFLEFQKQSNLKSFHEAIDRVLEEFSRRVEFSLACTCLSEELYSKIQTQTLTNAGIRKKFSKRVGGDSSLTASSFDPLKLINIVKEVAMSPFGEADKLELVRAQAQLLSINRWKGYYELPKFDKHVVVFNDTNHISGVKNDYESETMVDIAIDIKHDEVAISGKGDLKTQDSSIGKRKRNSEDLKDSGQKGKKLSNSPSKKPRRSWKKKHGSEENAGNELILHASSIKDKVGSTATVINIPITQVEPGKINQSFRVGDRIQKVAHKLTESNPILKHGDGISQKDVTKTESNPLMKHNDEISQKAVTKTERGRKRSKKLCLHMDLTHPEAQEALELVSRGKTENKSTKTRKRRKDSASIEASDSEFIKDTYWTDMLIQGIAEDQVSLENQNETVVDCNVQTPSEKIIPTAVEQDGALCPGVNYAIQDEPRERVEPENCVEDPYPTAFILTFTDLKSVPSETNLNDIFRKYGPLYESKTEVIKNSRRAKVVFKRTSDAEAAFSSTGKYSIFGTALVSYRLKFLPLTKVLPRQTRRGRKKTKS